MSRNVKKFTTVLSERKIAREVVRKLCKNSNLLHINVPKDWVEHFELVHKQEVTLTLTKDGFIVKIGDRDK